jgi:ribose-phosphate pyrophosphokinase
MMDTAGTICKAANALLRNGAKSVMCCATHGVLSGDAVNSLNNVSFSEIVLSNTITIPKEKNINNLKILSVGPIFAQAINRIHKEESISSLFI